MITVKFTTAIYFALAVERPARRRILNVLH